MEERDAFVKGIKAIIDGRDDLTVSGVALRAGLADSTLRKILSGAAKSPKVATAEQIAAAAGYPLHLVIAIGAHPNGLAIAKLMDSINKLGVDEIAELRTFAEWLAHRAQEESGDAAPGVTESPGLVRLPPPDKTD